MAFSEKIAERLRELLKGKKKLIEKKMFGKELRGKLRGAYLLLILAGRIKSK